MYQRLRGDASESLQGAPERVRLHVIRESCAPVDLDRGNQLAIARLELRDTADVHPLELEPELRLQRVELRQGAVAQVAALRVVDDDARGYG